VWRNGWSFRNWRSRWCKLNGNGRSVDGKGGQFWAWRKQGAGRKFRNGRRELRNGRREFRDFSDRWFVSKRRRCVSWIRRESVKHFNGQYVGGRWFVYF
jgi:hypothetical protein